MFVTKPTVLLRQIILSDKHWWFSGRILACHAGDLGSIPGQCKCSASSCSGIFFYLSRPGVSAASEEYNTKRQQGLNPWPLNLAASPEKRKRKQREWQTGLNCWILDLPLNALPLSYVPSWPVVFSYNLQQLIPDIFCDLLRSQSQKCVLHMIADDRRTFCDLRSAIRVQVNLNLSTKKIFLFTIRAYYWKNIL